MSAIADIVLKMQELAALKRQLASTDYQIVKCYEYSLQGLELPYDMNKLHAEREDIRVRIRSLSQIDE